MRFGCALFLLVVSAAFAQPAAGGHEKLHAVLWAQTSIEYRAATLQAYKAAQGALDAALQDKDWTAAIEQTAKYQHLPPAIIVDIDETILDNSPSQARMIEKNVEFGAVWDEWVREGQAKPIPGALEFLQHAFSRGVTIFYISNRDQNPHGEATRANLQRAGFPMREGVETVLLRGGKPEWTAEKSIRRNHVAHSYRIVLLIGDDSGDFLPNVRVSVETRLERARPYDAFWGVKWFMIPNATYGSWEEAPYSFDRALPEPQKRAAKRKALKQ